MGELGLKLQLKMKLVHQKARATKCIRHSLILILLAPLESGVVASCIAFATHKP